MLQFLCEMLQDSIFSPVLVQEEVRHIDLTVHGTVGSESGSAMARTVSLPMAIAAKLLLDGKQGGRGGPGPPFCSLLL